MLLQSILSYLFNEAGPEDHNTDDEARALRRKAFGTSTQGRRPGEDQEDYVHRIRGQEYARRNDGDPDPEIYRPGQHERVARAIHGSHHDHMTDSGYTLMNSNPGGKGKAPSILYRHPDVSSLRLHVSRIGTKPMGYTAVAKDPETGVKTYHDKTMQVPNIRYTLINRKNNDDGTHSSSVHSTYSSAENVTNRHTIAHENAHDALESHGWNKFYDTDKESRYSHSDYRGHALAMNRKSLIPTLSHFSYGKDSDEYVKPGALHTLSRMSHVKTFDKGTPIEDIHRYFSSGAHNQSAVAQVIGLHPNSDRFRITSKKK